jgi:hypothetical protein
MNVPVDQHLQNFRELHGEEAWKSEVRRLALAGIRTSPQHEAYWRDLTKDFDWLNWDELKAQATSETIPRSPDQMMAELLRKQMPGIKSQAQYDAVLGALDAVRLVVNAILERDRFKEAEGRKALELAFHAVDKTTDATIKLEDSPEAASSPASAVFKAPPAQYHESGILDRLMGELSGLETQDDLTVWYAATKSDRDSIVTQSLRNTLMDAIRAKKTILL